MLKLCTLFLVPVLAFCPVWVWYWQRLTDPSDEPLGALALLTLAILIGARKVPFRADISRKRVAVAAAIVGLYCVTFLWAPKMVHAILALAVVGIVLAGALPAGAFVAGDWLLLLLSLPLVASMNFFVGYPLRLVVTQAALALLRLTGFAVDAQGTALVWNSQLVEVDAPCSGLKMLWFSLYLAATLASAQRLPWRSVLLLLPSAVVAAVVGNVLRVSSLFYLETGAVPVPQGMDKLLHEGTGVSVFVLVALVVVGIASRLAKAQVVAGVATAVPEAPSAPVASASPGMPWYRRAEGIGFILACAVATLIPLSPVSRGTSLPSHRFPGFPTEFAGRSIKPVEMPESQRRFLSGFPGEIGVFSDGHRVIVLRWIAHETRQLHPASDCYRGSGYSVDWLPLLIDSSGRRWSRISAVRGAERLIVRERIYDEEGRSWSDVSAWHWDALFRKSIGPWWAVTVVERQR